MPQNQQDQELVPAKNSKVNISFDLRHVVLLLLVVIAGMLFAWKPWDQSSTANDERTITVSGEAKIKAEPDEFIFQPNYEFKDASQDIALANLTKKSDEVVKKLTEIGVSENKIKTNSDENHYLVYPDDGRSDKSTYSLRLTVTADKRELAQKVQNYLVTSSPSGQISPQAKFSDAKRRELESKARDEATKDARAKADQSAKNLGFKIGKLKSIDDGTRFGSVDNLMRSSDLKAGAEEGKPADLGIQPGEEELVYSVKAVYYIR